MSNIEDSNLNTEVPSGQVGENSENLENPTWLKWSDQYFIGTIGIIVFVTLLLQWGWFQNWSRTQAKIDRPAELKYQFSIDINTATAIEWSQLEGIGEITAEKILEDIRKNGPFESADDVQRVSGIGKITLQKIRPYLRIGSEKFKEKEKTKGSPGS